MSSVSSVSAWDFPLCFFSIIIFMKAELMMAVGTAIIEMPINMMRLPSNLPSGVMGKISPYPTVVNVSTAHQRPSPTFLKA